MAQTKFVLIKDKIYNSYLPLINEQIEIIKNFKIEGYEFLSPLHEINKVYSLQELTSFFIVNSNRKRSGIESNNNNDDRMRETEGFRIEEGVFCAPVHLINEKYSLRKLTSFFIISKQRDAESNNENAAINLSNARSIKNVGSNKKPT